MAKREAEVLKKARRQQTDASWKGEGCGRRRAGRVREREGEEQVSLFVVRIRKIVDVVGQPITICVFQQAELPVRRVGGRSAPSLSCMQELWSKEETQMQQQRRASDLLCSELNVQATTVEICLQRHTESESRGRGHGG